MSTKIDGKVFPDKIHLIDLKVFKSNLETTDDFLSNPVKPVGFNFGFSQRSGFNFENNQVRIVINILLQGMKSENEPVGIKAEYGFDFRYIVDNLKDFVIKGKDKKKTVSGKLGITLISIAYSSTRGIVLERTQGTYLNGIILPIIDPKELLTGNLNIPQLNIGSD